MAASAKQQIFSSPEVRQYITDHKHNEEKMRNPKAVYAKASSCSASTARWWVWYCMWPSVQGQM